MQALEARKTAKLKRVYYDLEDMIKTNKDGQTPYTPVLPLLYGMQASMKLMRAEGFENVIKRHHRSGSPHKWSCEFLSAFSCFMCHDVLLRASEVSCSKLV